MKRLLAILFVLCFVLSLYAGTNDQRIYSLDSSVYSDMEKLYIATGHALPSTSGPWSGDEMVMMLEVLDENEIPSYLLSSYNRVKDELYGFAETEYKNGAMNLSGYLSLDIYAHTYDGSISRTDLNGIEEKAFAGRASWFGKDLTKNNPFFLVDWEVWSGNNFYSYFNVYLSNSHRGGKEIGSTLFNSNVPMFQNFQMELKMLDVNFPNRAFVSVGGEGWNIEVGRDRLKWGVGTTGSLVLSDNFPYHDMVKATVYSEKYKYTYLLSFFPNKMNYYNASTGKYEGNNYNNSTRVLKGIAFYAGHRFEGRLFSDKLSFAVTEALIYASEESSIQIQALSPMYFMHNTYMPENSNSTLAFELNWTPIKGLNIYGQMLFDQFAMPGFETAPGPDKDENTTTDGKAFLVGAKYITGLREGTLTINPEVVYVQPYTYLRDYGKNYGLDYVGAVRYRLYSYEDYADHTDILYDEYVLGYTYGPDSFVLAMKSQWEKGALTLGAKAFFLAHGTHDIWTEWVKVPANTSKEDYDKHFGGLSSDHTNSNNYRYGDDAKTNRDSASYTFDLGISVKYEFTPSLSVFGAVDYVWAENIYNVSANDASDLQVILGVTYKPF